MSRPGADQTGPASADNAPALHLLIPTHTTRHLAACLAALARQRRAPDSVVVTCDTDDAAIGALLAEWWPRVGDSIARRGLRPPTLLHAFRPHQGEARLNQVRNNGLRALDAAGRLRDGDLVVVIDGDMVLDSNALAQHHAARASGAELIIPYRNNLTERDPVSPQDLLSPPDGEIAALDHAATLARTDLRRRQRRYQRQLRLRRLLPALVKAHKPKILGGHHAVSVRVLRAINGYDEAYVGYGFDDDDLSRRIYGLSPPARVSIAVDSILAFHLWHPTRAPARPTDAPGHARFRRRDLPVYAHHGWKDPAAQPQPTVRVIAGCEPRTRPRSPEGSGG